LVAIELIQQGATNDYCVGNGKTALHCACFNGIDSVVEKILEKYPEQIEAKEIRAWGFGAPIGDAFHGQEYKIVELLLQKGANNVIWNLLRNDGDYPTKLKLIEKYRNVKDELNDLIIMEKLGLLEPNRSEYRRFIQNLSSLIEYYKDNEEIRKCIESILERCNLFRSIDTLVEPLLWNYEKTFLASYFHGKNIKEKISISRKNNELKVSTYC
jgi:hypothetical protein